MNWRLGGPSSESRPNDTNFGRGRPDSERRVSIGGGPGCDLRDEIELASEIVSSSLRRDGMAAVVGSTALEMQSAPAVQTDGYGRSGQGRYRCLLGRVQKINRPEESFRVGALQV